MKIFVLHIMHFTGN